MMPKYGDQVTCSALGHPRFAHHRTQSCAEPVAYPPSAVDPDRGMSEGEVKALIVIEAVERLMIRAHRLLEGGSENDRIEAQSLLESAIDLTTTRTVTAVKKQMLSDAISAAARQKVALVTDDVERRMAPLREEPKVEKGVWRHSDDLTPCVAYPDPLDFTLVNEPVICSLHGRTVVCVPAEDGKG